MTTGKKQLTRLSLCVSETKSAPYNLSSTHGLCMYHPAGSERPPPRDGDPSTHGLSSFFNFLTELLTQSITKDLIHSLLVGSGNWSLMVKLRQSAGSLEGEREKGEGMQFYTSASSCLHFQLKSSGQTISISPVPPELIRPWRPCSAGYYSSQAADGLT